MVSCYAGSRLYVVDLQYTVPVKRLAERRTSYDCSLPILVHTSHSDSNWRARITHCGYTDRHVLQRRHYAYKSTDCPPPYPIRPRYLYRDTSPLQQTAAQWSSVWVWRQTDTIWRHRRPAYSLAVLIQLAQLNQNSLGDAGKVTYSTPNRISNPPT